MDLAHLDWPFFDDQHRHFGRELEAWASANVARYINHSDTDRSCCDLVRAFGEAGWLKAVVPAAYGGLSPQLDVRTICLAREILSWHDSLADFAFAMQGLGTGSITLYGTEEQKARYLPPVRKAPTSPLLPYPSQKPAPMSAHSRPRPCRTATTMCASMA